MATKFQQLISSNNAYANRSTAIEQKAKIAQESIVNALKNRKANLELRIADMLDFAPETTDSMRPGSATWNAETWAVDLQNLKVEAEDVTLQLKVASETLNDLFSEIVG